MKSKCQIPRWAILVLALAVALLAAVTIAMLHQYANESRQTELLLSRLKEQSYHLDALKWQFEQRPDPKLLEEVQRVKSQIAQTFDELMLLDPGEERLQQLRKTQLEFETNMDEKFRLIAAGDLEKADILNKERVDPSFNTLSDMITNTSAFYSERTRQAERENGIGTTLVMIIAGMIVGFLIIRFQKMQLRAKLMAVEQKALRQSEERYRTIIETAHDLIWTLDTKGNFTFFNRRSEETSGYKLSEWIGKSFAPLIFPEDLPKIQEVFLKTLQGNPQSYDVRVYRKDGKMFILSVNTVPLYENDKIIGTVSFGRDITEHKQVGEALQRSEEKYRILIENIQDGVFIIQDAKIQFANESFARIAGYTMEEVIGKDFQELVAPEDLKMVTDRYYRRQAGEDVPKEYEFRVLHKDGVTRILVNTNVGLITFRSRVALVGTVKDITERKKAELEYKTLLKTALDGFYVVDTRGHILDVNDSYCNMIGYSRDELLIMNIKDVDSIETEEQIAQRISRIMEVGWDRFETCHRCKDGRIIEIEASVNYINSGIGKFFVFMRDITERKRAEEELRKSEERFRQIAESAGEWIWEVDADGLYTYSSPVIEKILGYKPQEIIGKKHFYDFFVLDVRKELKNTAFETFARKESFRGFVNPNIHKNGNIVILETSGLPILDERGNLLGYRSTDTDITERRRAEEKLRLFRNLIDQSNDAIFVVDPETSRILDANDKACSSLGYRREELLSMHVFDFESTLPDYFSWKEHMQEIKKKGYLILEGRQRRKDGTILPVEVNVSYISLGKNNYMLTVARDISERKRMENALKESEEKYRNLIENIQDGVFLIHGTKIQFANEALARMVGYTAEEVIGKDFREFVAPEDLEMVMDRGRRRHAGEHVPREYEFSGMRRDGTKIIININIGHINYNGGVASMGTVKDITERRRAEEKLRLFRNLIDRSNDAIFVIDPETSRILDANDKACSSLGYRREELLSIHVFDFATTLPDHFSWKEHAQEVEKKGYLILEGQQRRKDGAILPVEVNVSYISLEKNNYILSVARDISERKGMENALRESEEKYRTVFKTTGTVMAVVEEDTKISLVNEEFEKLTGYSREEVEGKKSWTEFAVKEDLERTIKHHRERRVDPKLAPNKYESRLIDRNGSIRNIFLTVAMIPGTKKSIASLMDITEHKRSEEQIQEQAALLDKAQDAILVRNLEDCITYWNKSAERLYGWTAEEAIGKNASEILYIDTEDSLRHTEARKSVVERGEWSGELHHVTKDGREIIVESRWTLMQDNKGKPKSILVINTDITGKKKLEEQFLRAQRMESIGTLAGGIAHDINNVLLPIMLSLELLREKFADGESQKLIDILDRSAKRGASLIKQVKSFARGVEGERIPLQTVHLISEIRQIAEETFPRSIEIITDIQKDLWIISGDATQLHQVLMNLCVNARDAMPDGGILSISAKNIFIDENFTHINIEARVGRYIVVAVTDTGAGIPPKIMDRIFEPFFTTKEHGKGTGLGLSTALGIVKSHGGFMSVYSEVGKGTTFRVYLPTIITTETQKVEEPTRELVAGNGELILIVDDEDQIHDITSSALKTNGYRVLIASNGLEAIALYEQNREEIKLVLMDIMMPVMDGLEGIQELRKINPELKIIAASGLTEKDKLTKAAGTVNAFLSKPYTTGKLLRTIHEVLSAE